jgi:hypothetical protein
MPEELVTTALVTCFGATAYAPRLNVHSDRGGQYCGNSYRKLLHDQQAVRSQSRRGDCYMTTSRPRAPLVPPSKRRYSNYAKVAPFRRPGHAQASVADHSLTTTITSAAFQHWPSDASSRSQTTSNYCPKLSSLIGPPQYYLYRQPLNGSTQPYSTGGAVDTDKLIKTTRPN